MEPFKLTRERVTFLALMAVVTVVVAVAAPFGSIALSAVALLAIGVVLIKAMLRRRGWWPLTAVEGTVSLCGVVLISGGVAVLAYSMLRLVDGHPLHMMMGWPFMESGPRVGESRRSVHYGDPDTQQRLKDALRDAGIPFTVTTRDGQEYVAWPPEHNAAAEAVNERIQLGPLPNNRNVHFPDPAMQKLFIDWLTKKGIKHEVVRSHGREHVVWDEAAGDAVREFMASRVADCKDRVAADKTGAARC